MEMTDDELFILLRETMATVKRNGWVCQHIGAGEGEPPFSHTVGLPLTFNHPEIVLVGFNSTLSQDILTGVVARIKEGYRFNSDHLSDKIFKNEYVAFRRVHDDKEVWLNFGIANGIHRDCVTAFQLFLMDKYGKLPWEEGGNPDMAERQMAIFSHKPLQQALTLAEMRSGT